MVMICWKIVQKVFNQSRFLACSSIPVVCCFAVIFLFIQNLFIFPVAVTFCLGRTVNIRAQRKFLLFPNSIQQCNFSVNLRGCQKPVCVQNSLDPDVLITEHFVRHISVLEIANAPVIIPLFFIITYIQTITIILNMP